jgi:ABC-type oligopeptide transport system ATPase subunit
MKKPIVVNLYGGPGSGKSTTAAGVFCLLKLHGVNAELITEFAKDLTWERRDKTLKDQLYVFAKQHHKLWRAKDQVDVMITDSPLPLSLVYGDIDAKLVMDTFNRFNNLNFFIGRGKKYNPAGRNQTEEESKILDGEIRDLLKTHNIPFTEVAGFYGGVNVITIMAMKELGFTDYHFKIVDRQWSSDLAKQVY